MCDVATANLILEMLDEKVKGLDMFTAFDVTTAVRLKDDVYHSEVRDFVNTAFLTGQMAGYNRELITLSLPNKPQALVYFPDGELASNYHLAIDNTVSDPDDEDDDNTVSSDPEVFNLTAEGRINIPDNLISQITPTGGTYDILIQGDLKCVPANKDGRVRIGLKRFGFDKTARATVNSTNNTIVLTIA
ncbi:MAG: hypothetical protein DRN81_06350 [Thermoproteota archaeon]|nr:MAG: hypothetical protein DRN81_06350 [Candidatus Korarchaeota archaeon]